VAEPANLDANSTVKLVQLIFAVVQRFLKVIQTNKQEAFNIITYNVEI
jgi:hypothetical protein